MFILGIYKGNSDTLKQVLIEAVVDRLQQLDVSSLTYAMIAVTCIVFSLQMKAVTSALETRITNISDKRVVGIVLAALLKRQYPEDHQAVTTIELFKWPLWPTYLKIHISFRYQNPTLSAKHMHCHSGRCSEPVVPLSDEDYLCITCSHAMAVLAQVCHEIFSGDLTIQQLLKIEKQKEQLLKLCKAVSRCNDQQYFVVDVVIAAMEEHKSEYEKLTKRICQLRPILMSILCHLKIESKLFTLSTFA